jgi:ABC-type glucose/galactose transport system permease subunit
MNIALLCQNIAFCLAYFLGGKETHISYVIKGKIRDILESAHIRAFIYIVLAGMEEFSGILTADNVDILHNGLSGYLLKDVAEIVFTHPDRTTEPLKWNILVVVLVYILDGVFYILHSAACQLITQEKVGPGGSVKAGKVYQEMDEL